jgi:hypothetical protein
VNEIGANQATLEVAYATAHALSDIGKPDQARAIAAQASGATDSLVGRAASATRRPNRP